MSLRVSTPSNEGIFQASKWLKIQVLLDSNEMQKLVEYLEPFWIFQIGGVSDGRSLKPLYFVEQYERAIHELKMGTVPNPSIKAVVFVDHLEALWLQKVGENRFLTKISKPVVHVQAHSFAYSGGEFRPMSMGQSTVFWGLQFSFPQIYQDAKTMEFHDVKPDTIFRKIQLWMRENSRATPFLVEGKRVNSSIRLGKSCFSWVNNHPQLNEIKVLNCYNASER